MRKFILVFATFTVIQTSNSMTRCIGGGDGGGVPLSNIPQEVAANGQWVKTESLFTDFLLWENTNRILYADQWQGYRAHELNSCQESKLFSCGTNSRFSRVVDPDNRYFTNENPGFVFDTEQRVVKKIPYSYPQKEIFWNEGILYSYRKKQSSYSQSEIGSINAYDANSGRFTGCLISSYGVQFKPAEQSAFPFLYGFDQVRTETGGYKVRVLKIDVRKALTNKRCGIEVHAIYLDDFPAPVKTLYHYSELNGNIFLFEKPRFELLWDFGKEECTFYNLKDIHFSVLNSERPVVALWNRNGANLLYPRQIQKRALPGVGQFGFSALDFSLSKDGRRLFVSQRPEPNTEDLKLLFKFDLEDM